MSRGHNLTLMMICYQVSLHLIMFHNDARISALPVAVYQGLMSVLMLVSLFSPGPFVAA